MEITDQRHRDVRPLELLADTRHGRGRFGRVHRDPYEFGSGPGERHDLFRRAGDVRGIGVGHRLDDDRGVTADGDGADLDLEGATTDGQGHGATRLADGTGRTARLKTDYGGERGRTPRPARPACPCPSGAAGITGKDFPECPHMV